MADDVKDAREEFQRCEDAEKDNRAAALEDIKFALMDEQWPEAIKTKREAEERPCLTYNKLKPFIRQVVNDSRLNKPSIEVHPVDSYADPETADVIAGLIRNIESVSNADVAYDTAAEQAVASGFGYWRVNVDYAFDDAFDLDIIIDRITNQFSVYGDPDSTAADSSDWDTCFVTNILTKTEFKRKYGDKAETDWNSDAWTSLDGTSWLSERGVLVAERWKREEIDREVAKLEDGRVYSVDDLTNNEDLARALAGGFINVIGTRKVKSKKVTQQILSGADVLEETKEFPCRYIPIVPVYGQEIIIEGKRHFRGLVNSAKDAQREYNYWRSAATELVALAPRVPFIGPEGAFSIDDGWATANTENHAYLEYEGQIPPQRQPLDSGVAAGALQQALNASDDMKSIIGMYDASLGARSNETSGKAILARQREGDVSTAHFGDNLTRAIRHTGKILIDMIPRVYTGERIIRVLGQDGDARNVEVNKETPKLDPKTGQPIVEQETNEYGEMITRTVMAMHDLSAGKYDVAVKSGPSFTTRREEAAERMEALIQAFPDAAPILAPLLARNWDWPQADEVAEKFEEKFGTPQDSIPPELQQQIQEGQQLIQQLQQENQQLKSDQQIKQMEMQVDQSKVEVDAKKIEVETLKAQVAMMEAETDRIRANAEAQRQAALLQAGMVQPLNNPMR